MHETISLDKSSLKQTDFGKSRALQNLLEQAANFNAHDEDLHDLASRAKTLAEDLDDTASLVQSCLLLADDYLTKKDYCRVAETLEPLLNIPLDDETRARLLFSLVEAYHHLEEVAKVLRYGAEALKLYEAAGDVLKQARLHDHLGYGSTRFADFHRALEHYLAQLELLKTYGAVPAQPYIGIGWVHTELGNYKKALAYLQEGLVKAREEQDEVSVGRCLGNMANVFEYMEDSAKGLDYHQQATDVFEARGDLRRAMIGYGNIGQSYFTMGDTAKALNYYEKALVQLGRTPNQAFEGWVLIQMGQVLLETNPAKAKAYLFDGLAKLNAVGSNDGVEQAQHLLSKLYEQQGDSAKALEHYKIYAELQIQQLKDLNEKRTQALSIQFEVEHLQQAQEIYQLKNVELARAVEKLEELSTRDSLTGLYNRRYLDTHLANVFLEARANKQALTVLISDIDNFKWVNDSFSHATGDEVLRIVAQHFSDHTWGADVVARYGGEEFVVVFKDTPLEQAEYVAEKLRQKVEMHPWHELQPGLVITLSTGLCADTSLSDHERMLSVADDKLYEAKRSGKNKVVS